MDGYCERHQRAFELVRIPGSWTFECPQCRQEGRYVVYDTTSTEIDPATYMFRSTTTADVYPTGTLLIWKYCPSTESYFSTPYIPGKYATSNVEIQKETTEREEEGQQQ